MKIYEIVHFQVEILNKRKDKMNPSTSPCVIDHSAIKKTVQEAVQNGMEKSGYVQVTNARPMWIEGYNDVYNEIPLHSDQFFDKGNYYELKQHLPVVTASDITVYEQQNHLHLDVKKEKGNIKYIVHKQIPLPASSNRKGITSFFQKGMLTIRVPKN